MFAKEFDRFASGFDKLDNGFDRLSNGLDKFAIGFERFASGFLSIFNTGLVRFLIELSCEKPVIPEISIISRCQDGIRNKKHKN